MSEGETLTIRQAAALLNVHPNTVRNRIKSGVYRAEKIITEHGQTYVIPRSELSQVSTTNNLPSPSHSQPLPDVTETMRAVLEPFVRELGEVREELGRERERRERLEEELAEIRKAQETPESPAPSSAAPTPAPAEDQAVPEGREGQRSARRPLWRRIQRRIFGGG